MADTVFVLGAGASKDAGAPLMRGFFERAEEVHREGLVDPKGADAEALRRALDRRNELERIATSTAFDLFNIEELFAVLEMSRLFGAEPDADRDLDDLRVLIGLTLEHSVISTRKGRDARPAVSRTYDVLVALAGVLTGRDQGGFAEPSESVAFVTFNYDLALEAAITWPAGDTGLSFDYQLGRVSRPDLSLPPPQLPGRALPLLKLHGSLNWLRCPNENCRAVVGFPLVLGSRSNRSTLGYPSQLAVRAQSASCPACKAPLHGSFPPRPAIVPPTWNKHSLYADLAPVWQRARHELRHARNLVVLGYSMPASDFYFRHLVALGRLGATNILRTVTVINIEESGGATDMRFQAMLGPALTPKYKYLQGDLEAALEPLRGRLQVGELRAKRRRP